MRQPLIVNAQSSPIAQSFSDIAKMFMSGPTPEERERARAQTGVFGAQTNAYNAQARLDSMKADELAAQAAALKSAGADLASLFAEYTPQGVPVAEMQGPLQPPMPAGTQGPELPGTAFPTESPEMRGRRMTSGLGDLFARIGKDNAAALQAGITAGQAFGTPDDMRRSMVLQGKTIDAEFAPTASEGARIMASKPRSRTEVEGQFLADNFSNLDKLNPYQREALGAEPKKGTAFSVAPDGTVTYESGGSAATGLAKSNVATQQKNLEANQQLLRMVDQLESLVDSDPTIVGPIGNIQRGAQTAFDTADNLTKMFGSVEGYNAELEQARQLAARNNLSLDFNPNLPNVIKLNNLLLYKAAEALAGQSGRSVTDNDIKKIRAVTGDPGSWIEGPRAYKSGLSLLRNIANANIETTGKILGSGTVDSLMPGAPQPSLGGPAPTTGAPPAAAEDPLVMKAREAIRSGKDRAQVIDRLRQMGVEPPPNL